MLNAIMGKSTDIVKRKARRPGRPIEIGAGAFVGLRLPSDLLSRIDKWAQLQGTARSDAIRRLLAQALATATPSRPVKPKSSRKAAELAGRSIDRLGDPAATDDERAHRKCRLIKGPREFRDVLGDQPKKKG
jgi:Ribbon-helix-helix protein, copG family